MTNNEQTRPVRVPNVTPGARSGLLGEVIGSDAITAYDENETMAASGEPITGYQHSDDLAGTGEAVNADTGEVTQPGDPLPPIDGDPDGALLPPDGDVNVHLAWVREGETEEDRGKRADAVYAYAKDNVGFSDEVAAYLSASLREAVYLDQPGPGDLPEVPEDLTTVQDLLDWVNEDYEGNDPAARARAVLAAEEKRTDSDGQPAPRKTLTEPLEALLAPDPA